MPKGMKYLTFFLIISTFSWGGTESVSTSVGVSSNQLIFRVAPIILSVVYLFFIDLKRNLKSIKFIKTSVLLFPLFYVLLSLYSGASSYYPILSYWKSLEFFVVIYWASTLFSYKDKFCINEILIVILYALMVMFVWLIILASINPSEGWFYGGRFKLNGYFPSVNPNALGFYFLYSLILLYILKPRAFKVLSLPIFLLFIFEESRTAYVFVALVSLFRILEISHKKSSLLSNILIIVVITLIFSFYFIYPDVILSHILRGAEGFESFETVSGRDVFWEIGIEEIRKNFPLGEGIGSSSRFLYIDYSELRGGISMHNSALEIILSSGLAGLLMILWIVLLGVSIFTKYFIKSGKPILSNIGLLLFIAIFLRSLTSSSLASFQLEVFLLFLLIPYAKIKLRFNNIR